MRLKLGHYRRYICTVIGNWFIMSQILYEMAPILKGPLTWKGMGKISWNPWCLFLWEWPINWSHFQPNKSRWKVPSSSLFTTFLTLLHNNCETVHEITHFVCIGFVIRIWIYCAIKKCVLIWIVREIRIFWTCKECVCTGVAGGRRQNIPIKKVSKHELWEEEETLPTRNVSTLELLEEGGATIPVGM